MNLRRVYQCEAAKSRMLFVGSNWLARTCFASLAPAGSQLPTGSREIFPSHPPPFLPLSQADENQSVRFYLLTNFEPSILPVSLLVIEKQEVEIGQPLT